MKNNLFQWQDNATIACTDPFSVSFTGTTHCVWVEKDKAWKHRKSYVGFDQPEFRTLGNRVGFNVPFDAVKCYDTAKYNTLTGPDKCWPYSVDSIKN
jgi:hypothetical protein